MGVIAHTYTHTQKGERKKKKKKEKKARRTSDNGGGNGAKKKEKRISKIVRATHSTTDSVDYYHYRDIYTRTTIHMLRWRLWTSKISNTPSQRKNWMR